MSAVSRLLPPVLPLFPLARGALRTHGDGRGTDAVLIKGPACSRCYDNSFVSAGDRAHYAKLCESIGNHAVSARCIVSRGIIYPSADIIRVGDTRWHQPLGIIHRDWLRQKARRFFRETRVNLARMRIQPCRARGTATSIAVSTCRRYGAWQLFDSLVVSMSMSNYPRGAVTCSESIRTWRANNRRVMLSNAKMPIFGYLCTACFVESTSASASDRKRYRGIICNDKVNLSRGGRYKGPRNEMPKSYRWIHSSCSLTVSMASSAASARPAWVDRRERCLDAKGPLRITSTGAPAQPITNHTTTWSISSDPSRTSHTMILRSRESFLLHACARDLRIDLGNRCSPMDRRRFDRLPESVTVDRVLPASSFLSWSLLRALVRRTPAIRETRYRYTYV